MIRGFLTAVVAAWVMTVPNAGQFIFRVPAAPGGGAGEVSVDCTVTTCYYIRDGGSASLTGTGACVSTGSGNWNTANACDTFPATLVRGAVYLFAAGTYSGQSFSTANSGTTRITIQKATTTYHGTDTGWISSYNSQALFNGISTFVTDYWTFNGQHGACTTDASCDTTALDSFGFKVDYAEGSAGFNLETGDNVTVSYVNCEGVSNVGDYNYTGQAKCFEVYGGTSWYIHHNAMHGCESCLQGGGTGGSILEHNWIFRSRSTAALFHNNVFFITDSNGLTIRYNHIWDWNDEGFFMTGNNGDNSNISIYGNTAFGTAGMINPRFVEIRQDFTLSNINIYNNTCDSISFDCVSDRSDEPGSGCTNCFIRNNLGYDSTFAIGASSADNNTSDTTNRFVDRAGHNYHLTGALAGVSLSSPYNLDQFGNTRGADGVWDRGANEYCSGGCTFTFRDVTPKGIWLSLGRALGPPAHRETPE